ncbi:MAG: hypothetical protein COZ34_01220 [Candidatus Pacebacteria bacterium CG_4_10_14_3_um_filter_34_15]|nr:lamin tail domain-containing protein [Candidatus Pacearchaeota archaeon]NCQ65284.1 lamin tail domain-containing protein [Candidatus Paceibacterota bacterium]OIO44993.1 MAG: hypothetical protein AUJ41_00990 [Candidatus Pacebacteria bacterium CG1_02_43_31]PIQ81063.1 MAG: hypothetical protein COV78_02575 [Candidatus Pacebacteria bacterium CG11_big_fil_rev_8_21_14_0_20_34_55]PIX81880.1 MAG: hypothetical protein COZ34_01220 [Candidatus Pacebacteria bacterium CG_4_10_14_3_um_filter_34_15]PJC44095
MKIIFCVILFIFTTIFFTKPVFASPIINEIYPKPNAEEKEWVEIYNDSSEIIDLSGWILMDKLSAPSIIFQFNQILDDKLEMKPLTYLVIEIENNKLNNTADGVLLINSLGETIDQFEYSSSEQGKSFSLITENNQKLIALSVPSKGLPNPLPTNTEDNETEIVIEDTQEISQETLMEYPSLKIHEIMSCPEENNQEWVKVKNPNNEAVNLDNWLLKDSANNQMLLSSNKEIPGISFITIYLKNSILNNSGDTITLLDPNKNIIDTLNFGQCSIGVPISSIDTSNESNSSQQKITSTTQLFPEDKLDVDKKQTITDSTSAQKISNLKRINGLLSVSNADKSSTAKTDNYISKQVVVKDNSLPKIAIISVIIGGAMLASSGLFFIK